MEPLLSFGLREGQIFHVSDVKRGLKCSCVCPVCNKPLIARKGKRMQHHFAHHNKQVCEGALQTALHIAAKEILKRNKKIMLPAVGIDDLRLEGSEARLYKHQTVYFDHVYLEKQLDEIVPDIILIRNNKPMIIEIAVSHRIDQEKKHKIRKLNVSVLEIDLRDINYDFDGADLEKLLIHDTSHKHWIYNKKQELFRYDLNLLSRELKLYYRRVYACPKKTTGKDGTFVDLLDDCFNCNFFLSIKIQPTHNVKFILCIGHAEVELSQLIDRYKNSLT